MRLIDADAIEWTSSKVGITHKSIVDKMPTIDAIPIEWLKTNLIGTEFYFGRGVDNTLVGELVWQMIVDWWREDNGDEWWREEQGDDTV